MRMWLRGLYAEDLEPTLESCVKYGKKFDTKAQRIPALTVVEMDASASIRVVPPSFRSLYRDSNARLFCAYKQSQKQTEPTGMLAWRAEVGCL